MSNGTNPALSDVTHRHTVILRFCQKLHRLGLGERLLLWVAHGKDQDVGHDSLKVDVYLWIVCQPACQLFAVFVVFGQRSSLCLRATITAAAMMPACRMPPPKSLRMRWARLMNSLLPTTIEPTGALRPLEKQNIIESTVRARALTGMPRAMEALKMRAPSMCTATPWACARLVSDSICSRPSTIPPQ